LNSINLFKVAKCAINTELLFEVLKINKHIVQWHRAAQTCNIWHCRTWYRTWYRTRRRMHFSEQANVFTRTRLAYKYRSQCAEHNVTYIFFYCIKHSLVLFGVVDLITCWWFWADNFWWILSSTVFRILRMSGRLKGPSNTLHHRYCVSVWSMYSEFDIYTYSVSVWYMYNSEFDTYTY